MTTPFVFKTKFAALTFLVLSLLSSCATTNKSSFSDPTFDKHYVSKYAQKQADVENPESLKNSISFKLQNKELVDTINFDRWYEKNEFEVPARVFHDEHVMQAFKKGKVSSWTGKYKSFEKGKRKYSLSHVIEQPAYVLFFYGNPIDELYTVKNISLLVVRDKRNESIKYTLDFNNFGRAPEYISRERDYIFQSLRWAKLEGNILYVCNAHWRIANASKGQNAYLTAIHLGRNEILWRSEPLTANANNFIVMDDLIISTYGFAREGAKIYAIDKQTGIIRGSLKLEDPKTGKKHILHLVEKQKKIYAKALDKTEYVIDIMR